VAVWRSQCWSPWVSRSPYCRSCYGCCLRCDVTRKHTSGTPTSGSPCSARPVRGDRRVDRLDRLIAGRPSRRASAAYSPPHPKSGPNTTIKSGGTEEALAAARRRTAPPHQDDETRHPSTWVTALQTTLSPTAFRRLCPRGERSYTPPKLLQTSDGAKCQVCGPVRLNGPNKMDAKPFSAEVLFTGRRGGEVVCC